MGAVDRLEVLGLRLPPPPAPAAAYEPWVRHGDLVFVSGQLPVVDGTLLRTGSVGADLDTEEGAGLARTAALNLLAIAADAIGEIDRVRVLKLTVFVASAPGFTDQHLVADGASGLVAEVLADAGAHARAAVGVPTLPLNSPVEVEGVATAL